MPEPSTRIIWMYWHQGWDDAPPLVRQALSSWQQKNPDYEVRALDAQSIHDYVRLPTQLNLSRRDLTVQKIAALSRLGLLAKHGGVWVDATVICTRPLSHWISEYYDAGFFAFRFPGADRLMSNWFIAAEQDSVILQRLTDSFFRVYTETYFWNQETRLGNWLLDLFIPRWNQDLRGTLNWHSFFARKILRVYPYFIFHYTFNKVILEDAQCTNLWFKTKPFEAGLTHRLQGLAAMNNGVDKAIEFINSDQAPMHKLNWRVDAERKFWVTVLYHLRTKE
ncbi:MAG: hypothetical protein GY753_02000 [Gammaproteobacteria bacterium]|nr:hypothetical protein [Gammaproteobacteria bacterium]